MTRWEALRFAMWTVILIFLTIVFGVITFVTITFIGNLVGSVGAVLDFVTSVLLIGGVLAYLAAREG